MFVRSRVVVPRKRKLDAVLKALALATGLTFDIRIPTDTLGMM